MIEIKCCGTKRWFLFERMLLDSRYFLQNDTEQPVQKLSPRHFDHLQISNTKQLRFQKEPSNHKTFFSIQRPFELIKTIFRTFNTYFFFHEFNKKDETLKKPNNCKL